MIIESLSVYPATIRNIPDRNLGNRLFFHQFFKRARDCFFRRKFAHKRSLKIYPTLKIIEFKRKKSIIFIFQSPLFM